MNRLRREVGEQLIAAYSSVEMPPRLVENEARAMLAQQVEQLRRNGQNVGEIPADAHEGFKDAAAKRVLVGLLVGGGPHQRPAPGSQAPERNDASDRFDLRRAGAGH